MTQFVVRFWSNDPRYSGIGRWGEWILVSSIDGEDIYIPDLPDGYGESETVVGVQAASTGIYILTTHEYFSDEIGYETESARMYHLDLESKNWTLLDLEAGDGEYPEGSGKMTRITHNGQDYISFHLTGSGNQQGRTVDLHIASHVFFYDDGPSSAYQGLGSWNMELITFYFDESDQLNLTYKYYAEAGSDRGIYHEIFGKPRTMIIPEEDYSPAFKSNVIVNVDAAGVSGSGNVYVAPAHDYRYPAVYLNPLIRFYGSSGNLLKEIYLGDLGELQQSYFNEGTAVSDNGQYVLFSFDLDWVPELLLVDIDGNYKLLSRSLREHLQQGYDYEFSYPVFLPSQQENKPKLFWTLFKNTVEV